MNQPLVLSIVLPALCTGLLACQTASPSGQAQVTTPDQSVSKESVELAPIDELRSERIAIRTNDVEEVARAVRDVFEVGRDKGVVRVLVDHKRNELIVVGTEEGFAKVRAVLSPGLIESEASAPELAVIALNNVRADRAANTLQWAFTSVVDIRPDEQSNTLIVRGGSEEDRAKVAEWAKRLDDEGKPSTER